MLIKKYHRLIGLIMLAPLCLWALTGAFFIIKPGYDKAYQKLSIPSYPIQTNSLLPANTQWHAIKKTRSILGEHLLVKNDQRWQQVNPHSYQAIGLPSDADIKTLIADATAHEQARYGEITSISKQQNIATILTNTGVTIELDWSTMQLSQRGEDTAFISQLYKLHYLQWTGNSTLDGLLEIIGLSSLILLTLMGGWMSIKK